MSASTWQLQAAEARLRMVNLAADLDLARPALGLQNVRLLDQPLAGARLLGVELSAESPVAAAGEPPDDAYVREQDLVAAYAEPPGRSYAPQIYWRAIPAARPAALVAGLELVISAQTSLLDARPQLVATSRLPATEMLRLADRDDVRFEPVPARMNDIEMNDGEWIESDRGTGCLVLRLDGGRFSYVEAVHPGDWAQSRLSAVRAGGLVLLRRLLIHQRLEKGVIVRARVRGWFVERADDLAAAAAGYHDFAATAPPLTT